MRTIYAKRLVFNTNVVGMPLMDMTGSMCVARGVLVVCPSCQSATYVLDIEQPHGAPPGAPAGVCAGTVIGDGVTSFCCWISCSNGIVWTGG